MQTEQVRAQLLVHAPDGVVPGKTLWAGLSITHQPEWHTYWKNSGDSGQPTQLQWTLPAGVSAGDVAWPTPRLIRISSLANYGYEGTVLLPVPLTVAADFKPAAPDQPLTLKLQASWLVCKKECIPQEGEFSVQVPLRGSTAAHTVIFESARKNAPRSVPTMPGSVVPPSTAQIDGKQLLVSVQGLPVELRGKTLELFPETPEVIQTAAALQQEWRGAVWRATVLLSDHRSNSPQVMPLVLVDGSSAARDAYRVEAKVLGTWPPLGSPAAVSPALDAALQSNASSAPAATAPLPLWLALVGALVGGLILNLMPCVFPVLAIKLLALTQSAGSPARQRREAWAYAGGVLVSFAALGGLMLALRSAGEQLGWGFQLQSPLVIASLAALFTLLALNLAGLFEFGNLLPAGLAARQLQNPTLNAALSGVLAAVVASPCTAPFMGASLGLALTLPAWQAMGVFAMLGLGMALPFLVATWVPALARSLPRPGAWMQTFRQLMAFPMLATVVWLVWVLGQQSGVDGAGALLVLLVALGFVVWSLGLPGRARWLLGGTAALGLAAVLFHWGPLIVAPAAAEAPVRSGERWQTWSAPAVAQQLAQGKTVFVDFTAAWCVTCQVNKKTTLGQARVLAAFDSDGVVAMRADWTRRDPAITAALRQLGRSGVPVYVVYHPGQAPKILSEIIHVDEVLAALRRG
ncbi:MAG: hypothetical protein RLZZ126_19 [Pseudomonadota bacterium]